MRQGTGCQRCSRPVRGFTFIELMLTLALLAVMASVAMPLVQLAHQRRQEQALAEALRDMRQAIDAYKRAVEQRRITVRVGDSGFPPSLQTLVDGVPDERSATRQRLYFLRRLPRDPMVSDPAVGADDSWGKRSYASPPDAPQDGNDVFDVFSKSAAVGLNGLPYRQW